MHVKALYFTSPIPDVTTSNEGLVNVLVGMGNTSVVCAVRVSLSVCALTPRWRMTALDPSKGVRDFSRPATENNFPGITYRLDFNNNI